jgi:NAD(P)-dependent dehydrogenase (short-subunit alcohol dehydrogenase family)
MVEALRVLDPRAAGAKRLKGKIAVVSGAGQGHGRATARRFAEEGATVMVVDRYPPGAERTHRELTEYGAQAATFIGDMSSWQTAKAAMAEAKERFGRIDILVNVAGGSMHGPKLGWEYTPEELMANVQNNLWTCMWGCWAVLPHMVQQRSGAIVNFGSHAVRGTHRLGYAAAKGGVFAITTSLSLETAKLGVRVNCVVPHLSGGEPGDRLIGRVPGARPATEEERRASREELETRHLGNIPMGRAGTTQEVAAAVTFLASDDASYITGEILCVGGGAFCRL